MEREKRNEMECEEGRKIESNSEVDRDRDRLSEGGGVREREEECEDARDESRAGGDSTRTKRAARGWICTGGGKRNSDEARRERRIRADTRGETRGERREERRAREETEAERERERKSTGQMKTREREGTKG